MTRVTQLVGTDWFNSGQVSFTHYVTHIAKFYQPPSFFACNVEKPGVAWVLALSKYYILVTKTLETLSPASPSGSWQSQTEGQSTNIHTMGKRKTVSMLTVRFKLCPITDSKPELKSVFKKLLHLAHEWKSIGILLGIKRTILENIKREEHGVRDCLSSMLSEWLKMVDPSSTWKEIVDAVQEVDPSSAQEIQKMLAH